MRKLPLLSNQKESLTELIKKYHAYSIKIKKNIQRKRRCKKHGKTQHQNCTLLKMVCNILDSLYISSLFRKVFKALKTKTSCQTLCGPSRLHQSKCSEMIIAAISVNISKFLDEIQRLWVSLLLFIREVIVIVVLSAVGINL